MPDIVNIGAAANDGTGDDFRAAFEKINNNARLKLTADLDLYVNASTGNDTTGDGSVGAPWATIQKAVDEALTNYDAQGFNITINVADGTYNESVALIRSSSLIDNLYITGNVANPENVVLAGVTSPVVIISRVPGRVWWSGFRFTPASSSDAGFQIANDADVVLSDAHFDAANSHMIVAGNAARLTVTGAIRARGSATSRHYQVTIGGYLFVDAGVTTIDGGLSVAHGLWANQRGYARISSSRTYSGAFTGTRWFAGRHGQIDGTNNLTGLGNAAGATSDGGTVYASI